MVNILKRQFIEWEKTFANHSFDEGFKSRIENSYNLTHHKFENGQKVLERHFSKKDTQVTGKNRKRSLKPLVIREIQIKTTMGYHSCSIRMTTTMIVLARMWATGTLEC